MFGIGFFELVIIAVVLLVVVGPKRLPEVMKQAGRLFVHLRRTANDVRSSFEQVIREAEEEIRREEAESIRKALQPLNTVHQDVQRLMQDPVGALAADSQPSDNTVDANHTPSSTSTQSTSVPGSHADAEAQVSHQPAVAPEHQPHGTQTFNPSGPGPLHKS